MRLTERTVTNMVRRLTEVFIDTDVRSSWKNESNVYTSLVQQPPVVAKLRVIKTYHTHFRKPHNSLLIRKVVRGQFSNKANPVDQVVMYQINLIPMVLSLMMKLVYFLLFDFILINSILKIIQSAIYSSVLKIPSRYRIRNVENYIRAVQNSKMFRDSIFHIIHIICMMKMKFCQNFSLFSRVDVSGVSS